MYLCCGEGEFPISRFAEIVRARSQMSDTAIAVHFLDGLHIEKYHTIDDVISSLKNRIPPLCQKFKIKMIIIDSIAGLVRTEFDTRDIHEIKERTKILFSISSTLKWLSDTFSICTVVVNQVTDKIEGGSETRVQTTSALGLVWSHCVNTR